MSNVEQLRRDLEDQTGIPTPGNRIFFVEGRDLKFLDIIVHPITSDKGKDAKGLFVIPGIDFTVSDFVTETRAGRKMINTGAVDNYIQRVGLLNETTMFGIVEAPEKWNHLGRSMKMSLKNSVVLNRSLGLADYIYYGGDVGPIRAAYHESIAALVRETSRLDPRSSQESDISIVEQAKAVIANPWVVNIEANRHEKATPDPRYEPYLFPEFTMIDFRGGDAAANVVLSGIFNRAAVEGQPAFKIYISGFSGSVRGPKRTYHFNLPQINNERILGLIRKYRDWTPQDRLDWDNRDDPGSPFYIEDPDYYIPSRY